MIAETEPAKDDKNTDTQKSVTEPIKFGSNVQITDTSLTHPSKQTSTFNAGANQEGSIPAIAKNFSLAHVNSFNTASPVQPQLDLQGSFGEKVICGDSAPTPKLAGLGESVSSENGDVLMDD